MNVIEQAEALYQNRVPDELTNGECECCNLLPKLVAECKRQQERAKKAEQFASQMFVLWDEMAKAENHMQEVRLKIHKLLIKVLEERQAESARWQALAVEEKAELLFGHQPGWDKMPDDDFRGFLAEIRGKRSYQTVRGKNWYRQQAAAALGSPRVWLMTEESIKALEAAMNFLPGWPKEIEFAKSTIRVMLEEAKQ